MPSFFMVESPDGSKTFVNLATVSDAWYGPASIAPSEIASEVEEGNDVFVIYSQVMIGEERRQHYFWWQGLAADVVQAEFRKAVAAQAPLHAVVLPVEENAGAGE